MTYRTLLAPLADRFHVLAMDLRGHGATTLSTDLTDFNSWRRYSDDLLALLQVLDIHGAVLAGHSMGGSSSLLATDQAPQRVKSLVLIDPVVHPGLATAELQRPVDGPASLRDGALKRRAVFAGRAAALQAYRGRGALRSWPEAMLADYVHAGFHDQPDGQVALACAPAWEAATYAAQDNDTVGALARAVRPTHVLQAQYNSAFRPGARAAELAGVPGLRMEIIADTGHFLAMERPDVVLGALEAALTT